MYFVHTASLQQTDGDCRKDAVLLHHDKYSNGGGELERRPRRQPSGRRSTHRERNRVLIHIDRIVSTFTATITAQHLITRPFERLEPLIEQIQLGLGGGGRRLRDRVLDIVLVHLLQSDKRQYRRADFAGSCIHISIHIVKNTVQLRLNGHYKYLAKI